jgi:hypothetical protein
LLQMSVTSKLFAIMSCERIHQHISSVWPFQDDLLMSSCVFCAHSLYECRMCALDGWLWCQVAATSQSLLSPLLRNGSAKTPIARQQIHNTQQCSNWEAVFSTWSMQ